MFYRSDWPEVAWPAAIRERWTAPDRKSDHWIWEDVKSGVLFRWIARRCAFESELYGLPIWSFRLEIKDRQRKFLDGSVSNANLRGIVEDEVRHLTGVAPWDNAYVACKVVEGEPLYHVLHRLGFEVVEHRRLYLCKLRDFATNPGPRYNDEVRLTALDDVEKERMATYQDQILDLCHEAFAEGHSRHFRDPVLLKRCSGLRYILAVMALNFEHVLPEHFFVALDREREEVCGFSVVGHKPNLGDEVYTQLLSAVGEPWRGRGIYRGLSRRLTEVLPEEASLLNVTHVDNHAIQRAYRHSGREHLADTVVLRTIYT